MLTHPIYLHISDSMLALLWVMLRFIDFRKNGLLISLLYFLGFIGWFELLRNFLNCCNFAAILLVVIEIL